MGESSNTRALFFGTFLAAKKKRAPPANASPSEFMAPAAR